MRLFRGSAQLSRRLAQATAGLLRLRARAIDASVGRVRKILDEEGLAENTIFVFMSDHGCHFMTRNQEYKRSTHNSSLRVPLLFEGPGFESARQIQEVVGIMDIAPTLLDAAGVPVPESMKGQEHFAAGARCEGAERLAEQGADPDQRVDDWARDPDEGLDVLHRRPDGHDGQADQHELSRVPALRSAQRSA